jgi:iron complex transport system substrate-binding protein
VDWADVRSAPAEVVIVSPCGFRLDGATRLAEEAAAAQRLPPSAEVWAIDADALVVRPGPRVVEGVEVMASILHPSLAGDPDPELAVRVR